MPATASHASTTTKQFHCPYDDCGKSFNRQGKLDNHIRTHTDERPFACTFPGCQQRFRRDHHLKVHAAIHEPPVEGAFVCEVDGCSKRFTTRQHLQRHTASHANRYKCLADDCTLTFTRKRDYYQHMDHTHTDQQCYVCDVEGCLARFSTHVPFLQHQLEHSGHTYQCGEPGCGQSFSTAATLRGHVGAEHGKVACPVCAREVRRGHWLQRHLLTHQPTRQKQQQHECPFPDCGKRYPSAKSLRLHVQQIHTTTDFFQCEVCQRTFRTKYTLANHVRRHSEEHQRWLAEREQERREQREQRQLARDSAVSGLFGGASSGAVALNDPRRRFACLAPGCGRRFLRFYDLDRHRLSQHPNMENASQTMGDALDAMSGDEVEEPPAKLPRLSVDSSSILTAHSANNVFFDRLLTEPDSTGDEEEAYDDDDVEDRAETACLRN